MSETTKQLKAFLEPQSLALVGISRSTGNGTNVLENLLDYGFASKLFPVNPNTTEILGIKTYASIADIPEKVDLAVILTPRSTVLPLVEECAQNGIKAVIVEAQGFADAIDGEGNNLQHRLTSIARETGTRIIGPNTFGVGNAFMNLCTAFASFKPERVPVAAIGQSGIVFAGMTDFPFMGKVIDLGNACDVGFSDALEYFGEDPDVKVIILYIEGLREDGRRFLEIARKTAKKKPIVAIRGGQTEEGAKIVRSHTGSLAGKNEIWKAAFRQNGITEVGDVGELEDVAKAFLHLPLPKGNKLGIMTYPMAYGVMSTDACIKYGLEVAKLSPKTMMELQKLFPSWVSAGNPVDLAVPSFVLRRDPQESFQTLLKTLLSDPEISGAVIITPTPGLGMSLDHSQVLAEIAHSSEKPLLTWVYCYDAEKSGIKKYEENGILVFPTLERAIRAFSRLYDHYEWLQTSM